MYKGLRKTFFLAIPLSFIMLAGAVGASWGAYPSSGYHGHYGQPYYHQAPVSPMYRYQNYSPYRSNYYDYFYANNPYAQGDILGALIVDNLNLVSQFRYFPHNYYTPIFYSPHSMFNFW